MQEMQELQVQSLGQEDLLEEEMATYSSTVAWRSQWVEEPDSPRGRKESDTTEGNQTHTHTHTQGKYAQKQRKEGEKIMLLILRTGFKGRLAKCWSLEKGI